MARIASGGWIAPISRMRPPQRGHSSTSTARTRRRRSAQSRRRRRRAGSRGGDRDSAGPEGMPAASFPWWRSRSDRSAISSFSFPCPRTSALLGRREKVSRAAFPAGEGACSRSLAPADGVVVAIDNQRMSRIARLAGAPQVPGAGVDLMKKLGDPVRRGGLLYRLYAQYEADLTFARTLSEADRRSTSARRATCRVNSCVSTDRLHEPAAALRRRTRASREAGAPFGLAAPAHSMPRFPRWGVQAHAPDRTAAAGGAVGNLSPLPGGCCHNGPYRPDNGPLVCLTRRRSPRVAAIPL